MPLTWSQMQTQAQDMSFDYSAAALTFLQRNINIGNHLLETQLGSYYIEDIRTGLISPTVSAPGTPTVTALGTTGATTYGYKITAIVNAGETTASAQGQTTTGNASLSSTNYNQVVWQPIPYATGYKVYRTQGGATQGLIGTVYGALTLNDTGLTATTAVPSTNTTAVGILPLPENCIRVKSFYVTIGAVQYFVEEIFDEGVWRQIQAFTQNTKSNYVQKMFRRANSLEYFPIPSSANPWTMIYESEGKDLSFSDYTTGTITTMLNGSSAVVGTGTSWTANMKGRWFQLNGTDQQWYQIQSVTDATHLILNTPFQGQNINSGSANYIIGEMPRTPGPTHHIPVYYALWQYFEGYKKDAHFGPLYKQQYEQYMQWAKSTYGKRYSTAVVPSQRELQKHVSIINPNWFPQNMT